MRRALVVVLIIATACTGGDRHFKTVAEIVSALQSNGIHCTGTDTSPPAELQAFARDVGGCDIEDVLVATFSTTAQRDFFLQMLQAGGPGIFVVGSTWIVTLNSQDTASKIRSALGGKIVVAPTPTPSQS